jgi:hypothetical protein
MKNTWRVERNGGLGEEGEVDLTFDNLGWAQARIRPWEVRAYGVEARNI